MSISIQAPRFSFVQFNESDNYSNCLGESIQLCLPVFQDDDVKFQFILTGTTEYEANLLAAATSPVTIGIVTDCDGEMITTFDPSLVERFKIGATHVLFNFKEGLTDFADFIEVSDCFMIKVLVSIDGNDYSFCSNCFQRIDDDCHTSVVEYGADDNAFGFNYCAGVDEELIQSGECEPTFITFTNQATLAIPYTAGLIASYGNFPTVDVWIRDENNDLVKMVVEVKLDAYPPTVININFGGPATGLIKIS